MLKFLFPDILSPISRPLLFSSVKRLLGVFVSCFLLLRNPKINIRLKCIRRIREHLDYRRNSQKEGLQSAFKSLRRGANRLVYVREFSRLRRLKRWREIFFVLVREAKNLRTRTKKFSLRIFRKHAPQSKHFRRVFLEQQLIDRDIGAVARPCGLYILWGLSYNRVFPHIQGISSWSCHLSFPTPLSFRSPSWVFIFSAIYFHVNIFSIGNYLYVCTAKRTKKRNRI